jgi:hypothetical protein
LSGANLREAVLRGCDLAGARLDDANLSGAILTGASLEGASLRGTNLRSADFSHASINNGDLRYAEIEGASFVGANLTGGKVTSPSEGFAGAILPDGTRARNPSVAFSVWIANGWRALRGRGDGNGFTSLVRRLGVILVLMVWLAAGIGALWLLEKVWSFAGWWTLAVGAALLFTYTVVGNAVAFFANRRD